MFTVMCGNIGLRAIGFSVFGVRGPKLSVFGIKTLEVTSSHSATKNA